MSKSKGRKNRELDVETLRHRELLSRREVAFLCGCSERHVINLVAKGLLVEVSLGRHKRIPRSALQKLAGESTQADATA